MKKESKTDKQQSEAEKELREQGLTFGTCLCMYYLKGHPDLQKQFNRTMIDISRCFEALSLAAARLEASQESMRNASTEAEVSNATLTNTAALMDLAAVNRRSANYHLSLCGIFGNVISMILKDIVGGQLSPGFLLGKCNDLIGMFERGEPPPADIRFSDDGDKEKDE